MNKSPRKGNTNAELARKTTSTSSGSFTPYGTWYEEIALYKKGISRNTNEEKVFLPRAEKFQTKTQNLKNDEMKRPSFYNNENKVMSGTNDANNAEKMRKTMTERVNNTSMNTYAKQHLPSLNYYFPKKDLSSISKPAEQGAVWQEIPFLGYVKRFAKSPSVEKFKTKNMRATWPGSSAIFVETGKKKAKPFKKAQKMVQKMATEKPSSQSVEETHAKEEQESDSMSLVTVYKATNYKADAESSQSALAKQSGEIENKKLNNKVESALNYTVFDYENPKDIKYALESKHLVKNNKSTTKSVTHAKTKSSSASTTTLKPRRPTKRVNPAKIVVSPFLASNLLKTKQDTAEKILAENGLVKRRAVKDSKALHYVSPESKVRFKVMKPLPEDKQTAALASSIAPVTKKESTKEEPSVAESRTLMQELSEYSDSDSDEEAWTGEPFYLSDEEANQTQQSLSIELRLDNELDDAAAKPHVLYDTPETATSPSLFPNVPPYLNFSSHAAQGPEIPPALHKVLKWKLTSLTPRIIKRVALNSGFRIIKHTTSWIGIWQGHMRSWGFKTIRSEQKYNHMPASFRMGRKDALWRCVRRFMRRFGKQKFGLMQKTYVMPRDLEKLRHEWVRNSAGQQLQQTKWIVKPPDSSRGFGIRVVNKWSQIHKDSVNVVQRYIERPLLINNSKFDLRLYVMLASINPLRVYMYKEGLARFACVKYCAEVDSLSDRCMHLTNYSINKFSQNYTKNQNINAAYGHKWTLKSLWSWLEERGVNTKRLWATLRDLVIKTLICGEVGMYSAFRNNVSYRSSCYELFGFDVLLDEDLVPWLLEINISPSLHSELPIDVHVKGPLLQSVLNTALFHIPSKLSEEEQQLIKTQLQLDASTQLCLDKRIYTTCLAEEELMKHQKFVKVEKREAYVDAILEHLTPDDVRCLLLAEDELARSQPMERIFPNAQTHKYLPYFKKQRYYNLLLDAWEHKYAQNRELGRNLLRGYCAVGYHLEVPEAALQEELEEDNAVDMIEDKSSVDDVDQTDDKRVLAGDVAGVVAAKDLGTNIAASAIPNEKDISTHKLGAEKELHIMDRKGLEAHLDAFLTVDKDEGSNNASDSSDDESSESEQGDSTCTSSSDDESEESETDK